MKIAFLNTYDNGSTGTICKALCDGLINSGNDVLLICKKRHVDSPSYVKSNQFSRFNNLLNRVITKINGSDGFRNKLSTKKTIKMLDEFKPDIIHLHNVHGFYLNFEKILKYARENKIKVIWTLHDCWSFTGRCAHFTNNECNKWTCCCSNCQYRRAYPKSYLFDGSKKYFLRKKALYDGENIFFVTPSEWLKNEAKHSIIKNHHIEVINNGITCSNNISQQDIECLKTKLGLKDEKVVFSAAYPWGKTKGFSYIVECAERLKNKNVVFIVAGYKKHFTKEGNVIFVPMISSRKEMNCYFSLADVFLNTTLEDNYPTVNIESLSNGTPVITFDSGGSPETIDQKTGIVVERKNVNQLVSAILDINKGKMTNCCLQRSKMFEKEIMVKKYMMLYDMVYNYEKN